MRFSCVISCILFAAFTVIRPAFGQYDLNGSKDGLARAQADRAVAKGNVELAQNRLASVVKGLRSSLEMSPEFTAARDLLSSASTDADAERKKVIDQLHASAEYQAATAAHDRATQMTQDDRDAGAAPGVIMIDATAAMKSGQAVTRMDADAVKNDPDYQADKKKLDDAHAAMDKIEQNYKLSLLSNPSWQIANAGVDKARAQLAAADGALTAAIGLEQGYEEQRQERQQNDAIREQRQANQENAYRNRN